MSKKQEEFIDVNVRLIEDDKKNKFKGLPPNSVYELQIDYPVSHTVNFNIKVGPNGMGLDMLLKKIRKCYSEVYKKSVQAKNIKLYHKITDLFIEGICVDHKNKLILLNMGT